MAVKGSSAGSLSINEIVTEFGGTKPYAMNSYYRGVGNPPFVPSTASGEDGLIPASGQISFHNFYGSKKVTTYQGASATITTNQKELNLRAWAVANGWDQVAQAIITVNTGVYIWSDSTSTPALTIDGNWPGGVTLINNGYIMGKGGHGGGNYWDPNIPYDSFTLTSFYAMGDVDPEAGGIALKLGINVTIQNSGYIAGGGGGGGRAGAYAQIGATGTAGGGGGGAGGGEGGSGLGTDGPAWAIPGGAGGALGLSGQDGMIDNYLGIGGAGGGGRILPGTGGAGGTWLGNLSGRGGGAGGGGGVGIIINTSTYTTSAGGAGGSGRIPGSNGTGGTTAINGGGGGGWGQSGGSPTSTSYGGKAGALGGKAIQLNGYIATTSGLGYIYGAVS